MRRTLAVADFATSSKPAGDLRRGVVRIVSTATGRSLLFGFIGRPSVVVAVDATGAVWLDSRKAREKGAETVSAFGDAKLLSFSRL